MKNKFLSILLLFYLLSACTAGLNRSDKADEFLIEKKNPLVMPPDIGDLPKPNEENQENNEENNFKKKLKSTNINSQNSTIESSGTLQESIIKKIEE